MADPSETPTIQTSTEEPTPAAGEQAGEQAEATRQADSPASAAAEPEQPAAAAESAPEDASTPDAPETESQGEEGSALPGSDSITVAPGVGDSQFTTTSIVTTTGTERSGKKRRGMSKIDAANVYVYGHVEEPWQRRDIKPSTEDVTFRPNRAQTMRHSCIMKRAKDMGHDKVRPRGAENPSSEDEADAPDPITARKVPKHVYDTPKVPIKETKSSKFRYLFNRKPAGVKVYFKPANADPKKKPPFVVIAHP